MFEVRGDIRFIYSARSSDTLGPADVALDETGKDIQKDEGLETAVLISFGTDARALNTDQLPKDTKYRGGFWGSAVTGYQIGNRLWILGRSKLTNETAEQAKQIVKDGFAWLISDGIAESVSVETAIASTRQLNVSTTIARPSGDQVSFAYFVNWEKQLIGGL